MTRYASRKHELYTILESIDWFKGYVFNSLEKLSMKESSFHFVPSVPYTKIGNNNDIKISQE